ncbi:MAG: outer membrane beta-barrel protein [Culturomica sp.]|jgi:hypothetical protein|nr:outer membrane beta-barrel protein [Culturomica sp.]
MKAILLGFGLLLSAGVWASSLGDTARIHDLWTKKDTAAQVKKLDKDQEMKLFDRTEKEAERRIRILSTEETEALLRSNSSGQEISGQEIKMFGKPHFYIKSSRRQQYGRFRGHWCGINLGFLNIANADYSGYEAYDGFMDPDYSQSITLQANIFEKSLSLVPRNNFGLVLGLGLEYQHMQMDQKNISFRRENHQIVPYRVPSEWDMKKNFFKNIYLTVPLLLEFQVPAKYSKRFHVSAGVVGGIRLHTKTKLVYYNENGNKKKNKKTDYYYVQPVKADLMAQAGYGWLHFWGTYSLTRLFQSGKGPEIHPYSLGAGISF